MNKKSKKRQNNMFALFEDDSQCEMLKNLRIFAANTQKFIFSLH